MHGSNFGAWTPKPQCTDIGGTVAMIGGKKKEMKKKQNYFSTKQKKWQTKIKKRCCLFHFSKLTSFLSKMTGNTQKSINTTNKLVPGHYIQCSQNTASHM